MVRASEQEQTGGVGISEVTAALQRIGWGPVAFNAQHDLGTDLFVQVRDARRFDRRLLVGVQVRAGRSYFTQPVHAEDGVLRGWWHYERELDHFDDWVTHGLPHLLVLHDLDTRTSYWVHVTAKAVQSTGKGAKVLVPAGQTIDREHLDALLAVATSHKPVIGLEGTAWAASASNVAPARRLRHALLAPRLVAPHPNTGFTAVIGPEEAVALLAQGRVRQLREFTRRHAAVPSVEEAASSSDWRWRFVAALWRLLVDGDRSAVAATIADAPDTGSRAAACVVTACTLIGDERHHDAVQLLATQPDDASPVDWAWILTQRARARAEVGDVAAARQDAAAALQTLVGDPDDVTGSAVRAAAAQLLFQTAPWGEEEAAEQGAARGQEQGGDGQPEQEQRQQRLDELIAANDTAVSWWRTQTLSSGLIAAADRNFRQWADERATKIMFEDTVNDRLLAATVSADLTGEHGAWRTTASLLACDTLIRQHAQGDTSRQADALDELRRSGDAKSLELATRRLWTVGPLGPLAEAARRVQPSSWTHTAARANLALWQHAGDVLDTATASAAARYCLDVLADDSAFVARTTPSFHVAHDTLDALAGVVPAAADALHRELAAFLATQPPVADELTARSLARVVSALRPTALSPAEDHGAWRQAAASQPNRRLAAATLELLAHSDKVARELLLARIADGDNDALAAFGDLAQLDVDVAARLMAQDAELLETTIAEAQAGVHVFRSRDPAARLAILGVHVPDATPWDALLRFLGDDRVSHERKRMACLALAEHADRLPEPVRAALRDVLPHLTGAAVDAGGLGLPFGGAAVILAVAIGALDDQRLEEGLAALITGSRQQRRDAAALIGRLDPPGFTPALVALLSDSHPDVRAEAARALASRVARLDTEVDPLAIAGLHRALADPGALVPLAIAAGVAAAETPSDQTRELVAPLLSHPSAAVREAAAAIPG